MTVPFQLLGEDRPVRLPRLHLEYQFILADSANRVSKLLAGGPAGLVGAWRPAGGETLPIHSWLRIWHHCLIWHCGGLVMHLQHDYEKYRRKMKLQIGEDPFGINVDAADAALVQRIYGSLRRYERGEEHEEHIIADH